MQLKDGLVTTHTGHGTQAAVHKALRYRQYRQFRHSIHNVVAGSGCGLAPSCASACA